MALKSHERAITGKISKKALWKGVNEIKVEKP